MALLSDVILAPDTRANQPAATAVPAGSLYYVTDESLIERSNGTTWATYSGSGSGSGDAVLASLKTLSDAQVLAIGATPIEIVAAPGANKILVPIAGFVRQNYVAGYTSGRSWQFIHAGATTLPLCRTTATCTSVVGLSHWNLTQERHTSTYATDQINKALQVQVNAAHASGGNASNVTQVYCLYMTVDVS